MIAGPIVSTASAHGSLTSTVNGRPATLVYAVPSYFAVILSSCKPADSVLELSIVKVAESKRKRLESSASPLAFVTLTEISGQFASVSVDVIALGSRASYFFPL